MPAPIRYPDRSRYNFAREVLQQLGVPVTENNIRALLAQMLAEEPAGEGSPNNPFNTTMDLDKYGGWSAAPNIAKYPSWEIGVQETAKTFQQSMYNRVVSDLKASATPERTVSDIGASPWGTSGSLMAQILAAGGDLARSAKIPGSGIVPPDMLTGGGINQAVGGVVSGAKNAVTDAVSGAVSTVEDFALRAGKILLGIILLAAAIFIGVKSP